LVEVREGENIGILDGIFGVGWMAQDTPRHPKETLVMALHQGAEGGGIALPEASDEVSVG
jgi:hypothetical protein